MSSALPDAKQGGTPRAGLHKSSPGWRSSTLEALGSGTCSVRAAIPSGHRNIFPPAVELRTWHVCPPAVVHHPLPIPATVIPYKSNSIAPTLPSSSHDHISSSSLQRASPPILVANTGLRCPAAAAGAVTVQGSPSIFLPSTLPALSLVLASLQALDSRFDLE